MFKTEIKISKKDFISCNMYYLRKYIGLKEILMVVFLFIAGLVLFFTTANLLILILCGVTVLLVAGSILFYVGTANAGYKMEYSKRGVTKIAITFTETGFIVETFERDSLYTEKKLYTELEKLAVLKDRVYLYVGAAVMYYVKYDSFTEGNFIEFCDFIKEKVEPAKMKMKTKRKQFPYGR